MKYGTTSCDTFDQCWGSDCVSIQEKQNSGYRWLRRSYLEHLDKRFKWDRNTFPIYPNVPLSNCMVGSVSKRGITRREYALCVLEKSYSYENAKNSAEFEKPIKRQRQNGFGESPRSVCGNQSIAHGKCEIKNSSVTTKKRRFRRRLSSHDARCNTVFQNLGSDLIAQWLTPLEALYMRFACNYDWCWARSWHGGFVSNKSLAAFTAAMVQNKNRLQPLFEKYSRKQLLQALFYILPVSEYLKYVELYGNLMCLRKLL